MPRWQTIIRIVLSIWLILFLWLILSTWLGSSSKNEKSTVKETTTTTTTAKKSEPEPEPRRPTPPTDLPSTSNPLPPVTATPPVTPAPVATLVTPVIVAPTTPTVSNQELIRGLRNTDVRVAKASAIWLIARNDAVRDLVEEFASGDAVMKTRTLWCLKLMGESTRRWLNDVLANPRNWSPELTVAAGDVLDSLNGEFSPQPVVLPEVTNEQIRAEITELSEKLGEDRANYDQLLNKHQELRRELTEAKTEATTAARRYLSNSRSNHWSSYRHDANRAVELNATIRTWQGIIYAQSEQLRSLSEQIRRLSEDIEILKTRPTPPPPPAPLIAPSCRYR